MDIEANTLVVLTPIVRKGIPVMNINLEQIMGRERIDPFILPPIRDVFAPRDNPGLEIDHETVRFNPFNGEIFMLGQKNEQDQIEIDKLNPQRESFWLNFSQLDEACSTSKKIYLDQGKPAVVDSTEEVIFSTIDNFPQFFNGDLHNKVVKDIVNNICVNLMTGGQITDGDNQKYIDYALHRYGGIKRGDYSEQEKKSRVGSVIINVINDLIEERGTKKNYSPTLANLLVEQQIEQRFLEGLRMDFNKSIQGQLHSHFRDLEQLKKSLSELGKKYFGFTIFRCAFAKQSAEKIKKTILEINKIIDEYSYWNPGRAMNIINDFIMLQ